MNPIHTLINDTLALDERLKNGVGRKEMQSYVLKMSSDSARLARALKIAVEALEDAPHGQLSCAQNGICTCWKSRALAAIEREAGK